MSLVFSGVIAPSVILNWSAPETFISIVSSVSAVILVSASASSINSLPFKSKDVATVAAVIVGEPARFPSMFAIKVPTV